MKKIVSYLIMSLFLFNLLFIFYYYFRIISFWYLGVFNLNLLSNLLIVNIFVLVFDGIYILMYKIFNLYKLSYYKIVFFGLIIGFILSVLILRVKISQFSDYLAIISYFIINIIFISSSLSFDEESKEVFG